MPLFHFNLADHRSDRDVDGTEFETIGEAQGQAVIFAGSYLKDNPALLCDDQFRVAVTDTAGALVFVVAIRAFAPISAGE